MLTLLNQWTKEEVEGTKREKRRIQEKGIDCQRKTKDWRKDWIGDGWVGVQSRQVEQDEGWIAEKHGVWDVYTQRKRINAEIEGNICEEAGE